VAVVAEDYPANFEDFLERFATEDACVQYVRSIRWPEGFRCAECGAGECWEMNRRYLRCSKCRHEISVTAGTVFEDTRKPLRLWFHVMWFMMSQKTGVSAKNLQQSMGFGSYQTIWAWLHKLRSVMVRPGRERLSGSVEVDEAYIGGKTAGKRGHGAENKVLVAVAVEERDGRLGRVRFRCIKDASKASLVSFVSDHVESGSLVITDGWKAYETLSSSGYTHQRTTKREAAESGEALLPHVHLVVSLLKRWLRGTHQGAVTPRHLPAYLNEFAFRFNRRLSASRGKLFYRLMQQAVRHRPPGVKDFYGNATDHNI